MNKLLMVGLVLGVLACDAQEPTPRERPAHVALEGDTDHAGLFILDGAHQLSLAFVGGVARFDATAAPFWRAGLRFDAERAPELQARTLHGDRWSVWQPVGITFHEGVAYNGFLELDQPADALELRSASEAQLSFLLVKLYDEPFSRVAEVAVPETEPGAFATLEQPLAPPSFVQTRAAWGARYNGLCGSPHTPLYVTIHHTVTPTNDSMAVEARLRQIQDFHINGNGWCDVGYHFLISQDGRVWQGRQYHERTGGHVGGHNTNNVGVSYMGNYETSPVGQPMIEGGREIVNWLLNTYGIPRDRSRLRGHQEWPNQFTACPGQNLLPRLGELLEPPSTDPPDPPDPPVDPEAHLPTGCRSDSTFRPAFCDDDGHWAEGEINYIEARGATNGCADINNKPAYCPEADATRGAAIVMLGRIGGMPTTHPDVFNDMGAPWDFAEPYANGAYAYGITTGCGADNPDGFCPSKELSRSALAAFLVRAWQLPPATADHFDDDNGSVLEDFHNRLAEAGVTRGCGEREFCGATTVTRAALATLLARAHRLGLPAAWELPPGCIEGASFNNHYCDDDGHWGETYIDTIADLGITAGCGEINRSPAYCPDKHANRAVAMTLIARAAEMDTTGFPEHFQDFDDGWGFAQPYADAAHALGITNGCSPGYFCPGDPTSRSALAAFIVRTWALPEASGDYFDDDDGHPLEDFHNRLAEAGITNGCGPRAYCPSQEVTRAVLAAFIARVLDLGRPPVWEQTDPPEPPPATNPDPVVTEPTPTSGEEEPPGETSEPPVAQPPEGDVQAGEDVGGDLTAEPGPTAGGSSSSCGCRLATTPDSHSPIWMVLGLAGFILLRRRHHMR